MKALYGLLLIAALLLTGCAQSLEKKIVGSWAVDENKTALTGSKAKTDVEKKAAVAMMKTFTIEIKDDKTFTLQALGPVDGTWALNGNKLSLTFKLKEGENFTFGGKNGMELTVDPSGDSMSATVDNAEEGGTLVYSKVAK